MLAFDVATLFHALHYVEATHLGPDRVWGTQGDDQRYIFDLYYTYQDAASRLTNVQAAASKNYQVLDDLLVENRLDPMFLRPLAGLGVVSIVHMLVKWLHQTQLTSFTALNMHDYDAFIVPEAGRTAYTVLGLNTPVVELKTETGVSLWLSMLPHPPTGPVDLVRQVFEIHEARKTNNGSVTTVIVPNLYFDTKPDITVLQGADTYDKGGAYWFILRAMQQFRLGVNHIGAAIRVGTGIELAKGGPVDSQPMLFDRPFAAWFTQPQVKKLPVGITYADYDIWQNPPDLEKI